MPNYVQVIDNFQDIQKQLAGNLGSGIGLFMFMAFAMTILPFILITNSMGFNFMPPSVMVFIIVGFVFVLIIGYIIGLYNSLVRARNNVEESYSSMDISLKKRFDLIPNIVRVVKGYAKHEKETLENVIKARNMAATNNSNSEKVKDENMVTESLKSLFAVAENYPELKADKQFLMLQEKLHNIEDEIAAARKSYNMSVKRYNTMQEVFPSNMFAKMFKHKRKEMFELSNKLEREVVAIDI